MSTLGQYLRAAREARGIDLRDAAQQTRISIHYLKALEDEDFPRLPGEVFVKGFLKSYAKFLSLNENEVLNKYLEMKPPQPVAAAAVAQEPVAAAPIRKPAAEHATPIEPLIWGAVIIIALAAFLFTAMPARHEKAVPRPAATAVPAEPVSQPTPTPAENPAVPEKLYLEVVALEDTWVLVRTDNSPQKKAVLKKGESLIWSAENRFLLSYGKAGALMLQLNGKELTVTEPANAVIRDMAITAAGIVTRKGQEVAAKPAVPKPAPKPVPQQVRSAGQTTATQRAPVASPRMTPTSTLVSKPVSTPVSKPASSPSPHPWQMPQ
ncbi:MAG TPA: RodZ domain-containing protein [Nitrospirota bacterium]